MLKKAVIALLFLFIIINLGFIILRFQALGAEDNFFNTTLRSKFAKIELFRLILGLHFDGDGKMDYLGNKYSKILIEVDSEEGLSIPAASLTLLTQKIADVTGKKVSYVISNSHIPYSSVLNQTQIDDIVAKNRNQKNHGDTSVIYLLYLSKFDGDLQEVGSTYQEYGVLLFDSVLKDFTQNHPDTLNNYLESTALHEFGHQLGLPHNNFSDCLMQAYVDTGYNNFTTPEGVIVDFCNYEKDLIKKGAF